MNCKLLSINEIHITTLFLPEKTVSPRIVPLVRVSLVPPSVVYLYIKKKLTKNEIDTRLMRKIESSIAYYINLQDYIISEM